MDVRCVNCEKSIGLMLEEDLYEDKIHRSVLRPERTEQTLLHLLGTIEHSLSLNLLQ